MPTLVDAGDDNPFHVKLDPVEGNPFAFGFVAAPQGSMSGVTGNVGSHADWEKFQREARPSENVEDVRGQKRAPDPIETIGRFLDKAAQYGEPQPVEGNPFQSDPYTAAQPPPNYHDPLGPAITTMGQSALRRVMTPGEVVKGVEPARSGLVSDEDVAKQLMLEKNAQTFGPDQAMAMIGAGIPMAERGAAGMAGGGIKAYHGSPHDFEKFDVGKIGTGEGAQAYGRGLYFAEHPQTAESYKVGQIPPGFATLPKEQRDAILKGGRMYEVNINADPEHFLDWDKPLSEQSGQVKQKLQEAWLAHPESHANQTGADIYHANKIAPGTYEPSEQAAAERLREAGIPGIKYLDQGSRNTDQFRVSTEYRPEGDQYHVFDQKNKAHGTFDTKEAANAFAEQKNTEGNTHNYVVFHHDIVDILKKYGLAGLVGAGAAHFKTTPVDNNPFAAQQ